MNSTVPEPATSGPTRIAYSLKRRDVFWSMLHSTFRSRFQMGFFLLLAVVMTALAAREPGVAAETWHYKSIFCLLSFAFFMSVAASWIALVALAMAFLRPLRGIVGEHSIELREDGLVERTEINESLHKWAGVRRIRRTGSYLQIYVTDIMYHTIPIAGFQSRLHADAFLMQVRSRRDAAQP